LVSNAQRSPWEERPDGARERRVNGIRLIDRSVRAAAPQAPASDDIEHLITWREGAGLVVIVGLDAACRPVYTTTLYDYL
jgi:hypothetical protein